MLPDLQPYLQWDDRLHSALFLDTDVFGETAFYLSPMAMLGILLTWMLVFAAVATVYFARVDLG